jgi:two-component system nitrate/nitrite sensor histidine kinase NarX
MPLHAADLALKPLPATGAPAQDGGILAEIAAGLVAEGDLSLLLERFLDPIVRLAGAQAGAVRVLSDAGDQFQLVTGLGLPPGLCSREQAMDRHCGHCGAAADGQALVWASDLRTCSQRSASSGSDFWQGCQRLLAVPLQHRGRVLGVYNLFFAGADEPRADVLAILRSVGELLGLALNNARLEQETLRATLMSERQMMAAEVHDSLAQQLAFVKMRMPLLHDAMRAHDDTRAQQYYDDVRSAVTQAHASLRGIITHLRAPMDPQGLLHALAGSADAFRRSTGAELDFANDFPGMKLAPEQESQVFHIVQEALTNVARHAAAQHVRLHIGRSPGGQVEIVVEDDGAGLPPAATVPPTHYGMEIMLERARRIGGTLEIGARDGGGTRVRLAFPLHVAELAAMPGHPH